MSNRSDSRVAKKNFFSPFLQIFWCTKKLLDNILVFKGHTQEIFVQKMMFLIKIHCLALLLTNQSDINPHAFQMTEQGQQIDN